MPPGVMFPVSVRVSNGSETKASSNPSSKVTEGSQDDLVEVAPNSTVAVAQNCSNNHFLEGGDTFRLASYGCTLCKVLVDYKNRPGDLLSLATTSTWTVEDEIHQPLSDLSALS